MQQLPSIELMACTGSDVRGGDTIGVELACWMMTADCLLTVCSLMMMLSLQHCSYTELMHASQRRCSSIVTVNSGPSTCIAAAVVKCKECRDWRWLESSGMSV